MNYLRATLRSIGLLLVTAAYFGRWFAGLPFAGSSGSRARAWRNRNFRGWTGACARIIGLTIEVRNQPPSPPFLLVSNHLSYVDVLVLAERGDCTFVAKSEIAGWPMFGWLFRMAGTIFIDRKIKRDIPRVIELIGKTLESGLGVILFAEGTSSNGKTVLPFKPALLELAVREELPVHYARVSYAVPPGETPVERSVCWWGNMTFHGHLFRLLQVPYFHAKVVYGSEPIIAGDRQVLAEKLWTAVNSQLRLAPGQVS